MKFSYAAIAALSAACRLRSTVQATPIPSNGNPLPPIGRFELLPVGDGEKPFLKLDDLESFSGKLIIEAPDDKTILFDLYTAPADDEPCVAGESMANGIELKMAPVEDEGYAELQQTSDGRLVAIEFSIPDFRNSKIYSQTGDGRGVAKACIRVSLMLDIDTNQEGEELVSYLDAQLTVKIDDSGSFSYGDFEQQVQLLSSPKLMQTEKMQNTIAIESFLCGTKDINGGKPLMEKFKIGQDFQICIRPKAENPDFRVVGFTDISCGIEADGTGGTKLVNDAGKETSGLTSVTLDVEESMDLEGNAMGGSAAAFKSVVIPSYFRDEADSFRCKGEAVLQHKDTGTPVVGEFGTMCDYKVENAFQLLEGEKFPISFCVKGRVDNEYHWSDLSLLDSDGSRHHYSSVTSEYSVDPYYNGGPGVQLYDPNVPQKCMGEGAYFRTDQFVEYNINGPTKDPFTFVFTSQTKFPTTICAYPKMASQIQEEEKEIDVAPLFELDGFTTTRDAAGNTIPFADNKHKEMCKTIDEASQCTRAYDPMNPPVEVPTCNYDIDSIFQLDDTDNERFQMAFCISGAENQARVHPIRTDSDEYMEESFTGVKTAGMTSVPYYELYWLQNPDGPIIQIDPNTQHKCLGKGTFIYNREWGYTFDEYPHPFKYHVRAETSFSNEPLTICAYLQSNTPSDFLDAASKLLDVGFERTANTYVGESKDETTEYQELCKTLSTPDECSWYREPVFDPLEVPDPLLEARRLQEGSPEEPGRSSFATTVSLDLECFDVDVDGIGSLSAPAYNVDFTKERRVVSVAAMVAVALAAI